MDYKKIDQQHFNYKDFSPSKSVFKVLRNKYFLYKMIRDLNKPRTSSVAETVLGKPKPA